MEKPLGLIPVKRWFVHAKPCATYSCLRRLTPTSTFRIADGSVPRPSKGLLQAWSLRKILAYSGSSVLQADSWLSPCYFARTACKLLQSFVVVRHDALELRSQCASDPLLHAVLPHVVRAALCGAGVSKVIEVLVPRRAILACQHNL